MQILGLLGMYFDAVVVEVEKFLLFFSNWLWPYCALFTALRVATAHTAGFQQFVVISSI